MKERTSPPDSDLTYWIRKLEVFQHSTRFLPHCAHDVERHPTIVTRLSRSVRSAAVPGECLGLAALMVVVQRYQGGEPVLIALPADRDGALDGSAPVFASSVGVTDATTSAELISWCQAELDSARSHQPCVLEHVLPAMGLDPARFQGHFLQWSCAFSGGSHVERPQPGLTPSVRLQCSWDGDDLCITLDAAPGVLAQGMTEQLAAHVAKVAEWLVAHPAAPLAECVLLSDEELRQLAVDFRGAEVVRPSGFTLHGLVARQAERTPESVAVIHEGLALTYRQLDDQANRLASVLRIDHGVTTGACVGIMMDRSEQSVVAMCGVMKAGAAYVPINPRHPWDTVRYMIENAGISVLIVDSESIAAAANFGGNLLVIDIELPSAPAVEAPSENAAESDLAYVIYTSGSTGRPKGVAVEHRAIVNTVLWRNAFYEIGPADVNLQVPSFAFDSSVVDIFCVLTVGGTLVVPREDLRLDAHSVRALAVAQGVTSCIVTPSYYRLLLPELAGVVPTLRWVTLAGESATPDLVAAHLESLPGVKLFNEYGPTENAVCSTACRLEAVEPTVSIGRPIWNVTVVILDGQGRPVPVNVPGEVYLGGAGLARGYINQPDLTSERFVSSPVPEVYEGRLYRTGDRACWRPDGALEFLGRVDSQVKVRGIRIELDEVEQALQRHEGVRSAAVVCKADSGGANYLSAYAEAPGLTRAALREHMHTLLPSYMVPDAFTVLPRLPLNLNGKVDRTLLASIDDFAVSSDIADVPLSPVQSSLSALWADVLKRSQVALDDNFFSLGGNSLRVMELTSRIRGEMSLGVELMDVYNYPTVRELADRLADINQ